MLGDIVTCSSGELDLQLTIRETAVDVGHHELCDVCDVVLRQRLEHDDLVETVQELRTEGAEELVMHLLPCVLGDLTVCVDAVKQILRTEVRGQDDDGVLEVHGLSLTVSDPTVIEDLQEDVEDIRMRLLDFIEEYDRVWLSADSLGQLTTLLIADVARCRTDQSRYGVLLHVLGHIDTNHGVLVIEEVLCEGLRQLRLTYTGRTHEEEGTDRSCRILDAGLRTLDGLDDLLHRLVLADQALVDLVPEMQHLRTLGLVQLRYRDTGPAADDLSDLILGHGFLEKCTILAMDAVLCVRQLLFDSRKVGVLDLGGLCIVARLHCPLHVLLQLIPLLAERLQVAGRLLLVVPLRLLRVEL